MTCFPQRSQKSQAAAIENAARAERLKAQKFRMQAALASNRVADRRLEKAEADALLASVRDNFHWRKIASLPFVLSRLFAGSVRPQTKIRRCELVLSLIMSCAFTPPYLLRLSMTQMDEQDEAVEGGPGMAPELDEQALKEYKKFLGGAKLPSRERIWSVEELTKGRFER